MNLVKIAELLKNAPDQTLMQEMQNPSGSAPSYMILSELDRRKKLRGSIMNQEPQASVAEDMEAESARANQMGIGSMNPYAQAPQEEQAYAGGGEVVRAAGGWWEDPNQYSNYDPTNPKMQQNRLNEMRAAIRDKYQVDPENMGMMSSIGQGIGNFFGSGSSQNQALNDYESAKKGLSLMNTANPSAAPAQAAPANKGPKAPTGDSTLRAPIPIKRDAEPQAVGFVDSLLKNADADRTQMREAHQAYKDMLAAQTEEVKKSKNSDIALTLMQAGLGIAGGRSQYAMENIGQGAQPALQAYMGMDRDRQKQLSQLAIAQGQAGIAGLKDVQGINKDLGTLAYQQQHGKYFGDLGQAALMNARTNQAQVGSGIQQAKLANSEVANMQRLLPEYRKTLDSLTATEAEKKVASQAIAAINQRLAQHYKLGDVGAANPGVNTTDMFIFDEKTKRSIPNPNYGK